MTRAEHLAKRKAQLKQAMADDARALAKLEAQERADARRHLLKRQQSIGKLATEAGLDVLSDADLQALFQALTLVALVPDPGAVVAGLVEEIHGRTEDKRVNAIPCRNC